MKYENITLYKQNTFEDLFTVDAMIADHSYIIKHENSFMLGDHVIITC